MEWQFDVPKGWEIIQEWVLGWALRQKNGGLRVVIDCAQKSDGNTWIHVSASRKDWTPSHADMAQVKHDFIGDDRYAYSVWPPIEKYVNIHPHCLHLWARQDGHTGQVLPEFSEELEGIGVSI